MLFIETVVPSSAVKLICQGKILKIISLESESEIIQPSLPELELILTW